MVSFLKLFWHLFFIYYVEFFTFIFYFSLILKATGRDGRDGRIFIIEDDFENNTIKFREKHQVRQDFSRFIRLSLLPYYNSKKPSNQDLASNKVCRSFHTYVCKMYRLLILLTVILQERSGRFEYQSAPPPNRTVINPINNPSKPRALHTSPVSLLKAELQWIVLYNFDK